MDYKRLPSRVAMLTARTTEALHDVTARLAQALCTEGAARPPDDLHPDRLAQCLRTTPCEEPTRRPWPSEVLGTAEARAAAMSRVLRSLDDAPEMALPHAHVAAPSDHHTTIRQAMAGRPMPTSEDPLAAAVQVFGAPCWLLLPQSDGHFRWVGEESSGEIGSWRGAGRLDDQQRVACALLAQATALLGVPVTLTTLDLTDPTLWTQAWQVLVQGSAQTLTCLPIYRWPLRTESEAPTLVAVLLCLADRLRPPPSRETWCALLCDCRLWAVALATSSALPTTHDERCQGWDAQVTILDRVQLPWMPPPPCDALATFPDGSDRHRWDLMRWQQGLLQRIGEPLAPEWLHPDRLKAELCERMSHAEVEMYSSTVELSSRSMSESAWRGSSTASTKLLLKEAYKQFQTDHLLVTLFGRYQSWCSAFVIEGLPEAFNDAARDACRLLMYLGMVHDGPQFVAPADTRNPLYHHIRGALEEEAAFLLVPVFDWGQPSGRPRVQGIFLMIADDRTPKPSRTQWLQWLFFCQVMHDPVSVIGQRMDRDRMLQDEIQRLVPPYDPYA